jgi:hypothetical protein
VGLLGTWTLTLIVLAMIAVAIADTVQEGVQAPSGPT